MRKLPKSRLTRTHSGPVDVLLVNPPSPDSFIYIRDINRHGRSSWERCIWPQTSLAYLASVAEQVGLTVDIVDCIAEGIDWPAFEELVGRLAPRYCVSNVISATYTNDVRALECAKRFASAVTIGMGSHLTNAPGRSLEESPALDFIICNEAEGTFRDLIEAYEQGRSQVAKLEKISGLAFVPGRLEDGAGHDPIVTPGREFVDMNTLPWPRHDLLPLDKYWAPFLGNYTFVEASRGCTFRCIFCRQAVMWQWKFRSRSGKDVAKEALHVHSLGVENILFHADTFTLDPKMVEEMCDELIAAGSPFRWACNTHVKPLLRRSGLLQKMKQAGCWMIAVGIESGDDDVLRNIKKGITAEEARQVVQMIDDAGIEAWGYFVLGFPGDTVETLNKTIDFALDLPLKMVKFDIAAPYPGTEFYEYVKEKGYLRADRYEEFDQNASAVVEYPHLSRQQIKAAVRKAHLRFYSRPKTLRYMLRELKSPTSVRTIIQIALDQFRLLSGGGDTQHCKGDCRSGPGENDSAHRHERYLSEQKQMHEKLASVYENQRYASEHSKVFQKHWNETIRELADLPSGSTVLDFGCGTGILFEDLAESGLQVVGVDLSEEMLRAVPHRSRSVTRICADGTNMPFVDESFDAVLCRGSIHHLPELEPAFVEICRVLKPGGVLVFSEPSNDSIVNRLARKVMYRLSDEFHEEDEGFHRDDVLRMLDRLGFRIEESRGFGFFAYTMAGFPDKFDPLRRVPQNLGITKSLIRLDSFLESIPKIGNLALHWQVRAVKS